MKVEAVKAIIPREIYHSLLSRGIVEFTPPQADAIEKGILKGANMVVASPTASGKTLIAELACINGILTKGKKAVYIAPMKALATEKFDEFKSAYPYIKSVISIGDLDSDDKWLGGYQMLFFSTEKFDSLIRHGLDWLGEVGCFIFDEVHMIGDASRGPTMELLITKMKSYSNAQIIALSATIGNAREIAEWLGAELVESEYRPVKLTKGVLYDGIFHHREGRAEKEEELKGSSEIPEIRVVEDTLARNKQAIIFYATRRGAEFGAAKIAKHVHASLPPEERQRLKELGAVVTGVLDKPTEQCAKLGSLIANGVAFHHAGLLSQQRKYIEDAFRAGTVRVVCSTTTLGYGINMPAHTVLVRDLTRFDGNYSTRISVNEVLQLFGRAGRPKYDTEGRAIIPANGKYRIAELKGRYIDAEPEPVSSLLGVAPVLRSHILAFIAGRFLNSAESIGGFISKSLYGKQYGDSGKIETRVGEMMADLEGWEFVERHGKLYTATKLGERISELYIDPLSARLILDGLKTAKETFDVLLLISNTLEMRPHAKITAQAANRYAAYISANGVTVFSSDRLVNYAGYDPISVFSTAMMLEDWIKEVREADIVKRFSSSPGALYAKLLNADWMIYSATELARLTRTPRAELVKARVRLRYGIKEELLDLVRLEQIGRVRARMLYDNGIETAAEITKNKDRVVELLGKEVAEKVFGQLE